MKVYVEITLLPDAEINLYFLWEKVFHQVHLALVEQLNMDGNSSVGVAFPEYSDVNKQLGCKLRLLANEKSKLENLKIYNSLTNLSDYVHISSTRHVPYKVLGYVRYKREHVKSSAARLIRRKAKRENLTLKEAALPYASFKEQRSDAPFIKIRSLHTGQLFKLFVLREEVPNLSGCTFNSYGLSSTSSLPEF